MVAIATPGMEQQFSSNSFFATLKSLEAISLILFLILHHWPTDAESSGFTMWAFSFQSLVNKILRNYRI